MSKPRNHEPSHIDEAFAGHDDRRPTETIVIRISRDARLALEDAIDNGYPLMFWGDPAELVEGIEVTNPVADDARASIEQELADRENDEKEQ